MSTLTSTNWGGMTEIDAGIIMGCSELNDAARARPNARKVMIVLTDGNYTNTNPVPQAATAASQGIVVHAITFSAGADQTVMQAVAAAGGGTFHHAPDAATLEAVFRELAAMSVLLTD